MTRAVARADLAAVDVATLPVYPISSDERLQSHYFFQMHFARWLSSTFRMLADPDVRGIGIDLICLAQNEAPVGTLPVDPRMLSRLCGLSLEDWNKLAQREIPPLYGWEPCLCDGEIRLMHRVVMEMALGAVASKRSAVEGAAQRRDAKRLKDLRERIEAIGAGQVLRQANVLDRIDAWLTDHHSGNRTETAVRSALDAVMS